MAKNTEHIETEHQATPQEQRLDAAQEQRAALNARFSELLGLLPQMGDALLSGEDPAKWAALKQEAEMLPAQLAAAYRAEMNAQLDVFAMEHDAMDAELQRLRNEFLGAESTFKATARSQTADQVERAIKQAEMEVARERYNKQRSAIGGLSSRFGAVTRVNIGVKSAMNQRDSHWAQVLQYEGSVIAGDAMKRVRSVLSV